MELVSNRCCTLCEENTSVLSKKALQPFIETVGRTFFNASNTNFKQFQAQLTKSAVCPLCIEKINVTSKFKESYENIGRRSLSRTPSCLICDKKRINLVKTSNNPNNVIKKITSFMDHCGTKGTKRSQEESEMCLNCLFCITLWNEIHNSLIKELNMDTQTLKSFQYSNHTFMDNGILKNDKENVTPPHSNIQTSNQKRERQSITENKKYKTHKKSLSFSKCIVNHKLKNMKCLKDTGFRKLNLPKNTFSDKKLYLEIPYIPLCQDTIQNNVQERRRVKPRKSKEVINISDSDEESVESVRKTRVSFVLPTGTADNKISCSICDREFTNKCEYKIHTLWHDKPERFQIDLIRYDLPLLAKASEFDVIAYHQMTATKKNVVETSMPNEEAIVSVDDTNLSSKVDEERPKVTEESQMNTTELENDSTVMNDGENDKIDSPKNIENECEEKEQQISIVPQTDAPTITEPDVPSTTCNHEHESDKDKETNIENDMLDNDEPIFDSDEHSETEVEQAIAVLYKDDLENQSKKDNLDNDNKDEAEEKSICEEDKKRKKSDSPNDSCEEQNLSDDNLPQLKKVRFALDYSLHKHVEGAKQDTVDEINVKNSEEVIPLTTNEEDN
ncbi:hypothetical protein FQA39_LY02092 [Lamprigera yunnana]|nr:hypothetical protein FQA39_LY02092 [Lamprigera yunnana]